MPSKEEASAFMQNYSRRVQGKRSNSTQRSSSNTRSGNPDSLLTRAQQQAQTTSSNTSSRPPPAGGNSAKKEQTNRLAEIRMQPKNLSPVDPSRHPALLPRPAPSVANKKCLVVDVDETLVHSSYQPVHHYDLHLPLRVNGSTCNVYVAYRPLLREFLQFISPMFEVVIFTASVSVYCDPLMDELDPHGILGGARLFREHCSVVNGSYVKDLSLLGRPLDKIAILDNSPVAYLFQPRNAIPILSWFDDPEDREFEKLMPLLEALAQAPTVYDVLDEYNSTIQQLE